MATEAMIGHGSLFEISTDNGTTWEPIAEVTDITPPSDNIDVIDATHMQSPGATREFILGLNDPGEASFEMNFIPGSDADDTIQAVRAARERVKCRITWPNDVTWTFDGILTGYEPAAPTDDKMTATVTFKVTGSYVTGVAA
ncbi:phage tail tube protein [Mongoliimonas terrestris]|uniref:phage tail tube protein n=1 Tax=Mongoliimonas terrestris TaxID=1709001 RepID=UPI00094999E4|nr:phage tail tube protein [Mongoliimonas terrestris]